MQKRQSDQVAAAVLVVFSALVYFVLIPRQIPPDRMGLSSSFFPKLSVLVIGGLGLVLFFKSWWTGRDAPKTESTPMTAEEIKRAAIIFLLMVLYIISLNYLGFFISTPPVFGRIVLLLRSKKPQNHLAGDHSFAGLHVSHI